MWRLAHGSPRVSLVLATLGRTEEPERFFGSVVRQRFTDFEVVVVDQNTDGRLDGLVERYARLLPVVRVRSARGLSKARNLGLRHARGEVVGFPDDDCWYGPALLQRVVDALEANPSWDGVTGRAADQTDRSSSARWDSRPGPVTTRSSWRRGFSSSIFLRRRVVERVGPFDERLGVGAGTPWGSGEETDYLVRAVKEGFLIYYDPTLVVGHPRPTTEYNAQALARAYTYGAGMGRVLRKHGYPWWFSVYHVVRPLAGTLIAGVAGNRGKSRYHWAACRGRARGLWAPASGGGEE